MNNTYSLGIRVKLKDIKNRLTNIDPWGKNRLEGTSTISYTTHCTRLKQFGHVASCTQHAGLSNPWCRRWWWWSKIMFSPTFVRYPIQIGDNVDSSTIHLIRNYGSLVKWDEKKFNRDPIQIGDNFDKTNKSLVRNYGSLVKWELRIRFT